MSPTVRRRYGMPFRRYVSSVARHLIPSEALAPLSLDFQLEPADGKYAARHGTSAQNVGQVNAVYEAAYGGGAFFDVAEVKTSSATDGYPIHATLSGGAICYWDTNSFSVNNCSCTSGSTTVTTTDSFEDVTVGTALTSANFPAVVYVTVVVSTTQITVSREATSTAGPVTFSFTGAHRTVGATGIDTDHYPTYFHCMPRIYGSTIHRCKTATQRGNLAAGSRKLLTIGERLFWTGYESTPGWWSKTYNTQFSAGTTHERIGPWGHITPLWPGTISQPATPDATGTWEAGKSFYFTVVFVDGSGAHSMPFEPRAKNAILPGGLGLYAITGTPTDRFQTLTISDIPQGPDGTAERRLYRTLQNSDVNQIAIGDMQLWEVIPNNTTTTITSTKGNDAELIQDPVNFRWDHIWAPPARYAWKGDHRVFIGFTGVQRAAIILSPHVNNPDTTVGATTYSAEVNGTPNLVLRKGANSTTISLSSLTVEQLVDTINATTDTGANGGEWEAQIVPGADRTLVSGTTLTQTTGADLGDGADVMRCYSNAMPGILYTGSSAVSSHTESRRRFFFTGGGPGHPSFAARNFYRDNYRTGPATAGDLVGGGALIDGVVVCFQNAIGIFRNTKSGKTGLDEDYRLEFINETRGCVAFNSITEGDGWVGYMTTEGYVVTDGVREAVISRDIWDPSEKTGEFTEDMETAIAIASTSGSENAAYFTTRNVGGALMMVGLHGDPVFHALKYDFSASIGRSGLAEVLGPDGQPFGWSTPLRLPYNMVGTVTRSDGRRIVGISHPSLNWLETLPDLLYDFSRAPSVTVVVLATGGSVNLPVDSGDISAVAIGATVSGSNIPDGATVTSKDSSSLTISAAVEGGGVAQATALVIAGMEIEPIAYTKQDLCDSLYLKSAKRAVVVYQKDTTGMSLFFNRDKNRLSTKTMTLDSGFGGQEWMRDKKELPIAARSPAEMVEWGISDDGTFDNERPEIFGIEAEVEVLSDY